MGGGVVGRCDEAGGCRGGGAGIFRVAGSGTGICWVGGSGLGICRVGGSGRGIRCVGGSGRGMRWVGLFGSPGRGGLGIRRVAGSRGWSGGCCPGGICRFCLNTADGKPTFPAGGVHRAYSAGFCSAVLYLVQNAKATRAEAATTAIQTTAEMISEIGESPKLDSAKPA